MQTKEIISRHISQPITVLDIGARDGSSTMFLKEAGCVVKAYDPEPSSDDVLEGRLGDDFGQHDLVVARLLVHLVPHSLYETLDILFSYVNDGGYLYVTNFDKQDIWYKESAEEWLVDKHVIESELTQWSGKKYDGSTKEWFVNEYLIKK